MMPTTLTIRDECPDGALHEFGLELLTERLTVRELIRSRVYQDVQDFNLGGPKPFRGLVEPDEAERALNGCKPHSKGTIDWRRSYDQALHAFTANRILVLVGDRQMESLDEEIVITPSTCVTFLRLTLLTGG